MLDWQEPTLCQNMPVKVTSSLQQNVDNRLAALEEYKRGQDDAVKQYLQVCNKRFSALIQLVLGNLLAADRTKNIFLIGSAINRMNAPTTTAEYQTP